MSRFNGSIPAIAGRRREGLRRRGTTSVDDRLIALADIIGIGDAVQAAARGSSLTLFVAGEGAVAQAGLLVALDAEGIAGADSLCRRGANRDKSANSQKGHDCVAHRVSCSYWPAAQQRWL